MKDPNFTKAFITLLKEFPTGGTIPMDWESMYNKLIELYIRTLEQHKQEKLEIIDSLPCVTKKPPKEVQRGGDGYELYLQENWYYVNLTKWQHKQRIKLNK